MKSKYVMISGLAFSEESDMEKLKNYASQGWILEDIIGGFFYKFKKDKPQDLVYSLDYQIEANDEYFIIFKEAGWEPVVSVGDQMHIFSAQAGTRPIYSDCESEMDKYISIKNRTKRGTLYSLIIAIALIGLLVISIIAIRPMFLIIFGVLMIDIFICIFNLLPYLAYNHRIKQMKKEGMCRNKIINNKSLCKIDVFLGIIFLSLGISNLIEKKSFAIFFLILGVFKIGSSLSCYKKYKKSL